MATPFWESCKQERTFLRLLSKVWKSPEVKLRARSAVCGLFALYHYERGLSGETSAQGSGPLIMQFQAMVRNQQQVKGYELCWGSCERLPVRGDM